MPTAGPTVQVSSTQPYPRLDDRYTILKQIGAGGMGRVYRALDRKHGRQVAIKVLDPDQGRAVGTRRFLREIRIIAALSHPNIIPLHDSGEADGQLFYVMPFVDGETLRERLTREHTLPLAQAIEWAAEVADGLAFAHEHGIVHRDIKPENLLIEAGHVLIADFGIAHAMGRASTVTFTGEQLVVGTTAYMSPEQASGATLDGRADIYSLGCVLHEMLAGRPPFTAATAQAVIASKLAGRYAGIRREQPSIPRRVERVLERSLAVDPSKRIGTARELQRRLRAATAPRTGRAVLWFVAPAIATGVVAIAAPHLPWPAAWSDERSRVVVGVFENRTGDPKHDALGVMAADWVTEGLQRTGAVDVVPTLTAVGAARFLRTNGTDSDPVRALARETGARLVVSGAIYEEGDSLVLQAQLADPRAGRLIGAVEPVRARRADIAGALRQLRSRLMGLLSLSLDDRVRQDEPPPTYEAYRAFSEGIDAYTRNDYPSALVAFEHAHTADTSFVLPMLYASFCQIDRGRFTEADSVLRSAARQRDRLSAYDQAWLDYQRAELAGKDAEALAAIRQAAEMAPTSKATYNFAVRALEARQPVAAESALRRLSPDVGPMRGWFPYWTVLTDALHAQGRHRLELLVAREARLRFPGRIDAYAAEARALAAARDLAALDRLWDRATSESGAARIALGELALDVGDELRAHGDSTRSGVWFGRADDAFASADTMREPDAVRWGRARAAARLGRLRGALLVGESLMDSDSSRAESYAGFVGAVAARLGDHVLAEQLLRQLASSGRPYSFGAPVLQAARIAAALGDVRRAAALAAIAYHRGFPFDPSLHRDPALAPLRKEAVFRLLEGPAP